MDDDDYCNTDYTDYRLPKTDIYRYIALAKEAMPAKTRKQTNKPTNKIKCI